MLNYSAIVTGPLAENCYLLWRDSACWIIDPGSDPEVILEEIAQRGLTPAAILLTHGHFDHVGALDALLKQFPELPVIMRPEDARWSFTHPANQYPPFYFHQQRPATLVEYEEATYSAGGLTATLIPCPGHTPGGQVILVEDADLPAPLCFTGDTIFRGAIGRTDLPGGNFAQMQQTLANLKTSLAPATTLLPGHEASTTLEHELRTNPYLQDEYPID